MLLKIVRCQTVLDNGETCNRFLGKVHGRWEIKCPRCKQIAEGNNFVHKPYDKIKGV